MHRSSLVEDGGERSGRIPVVSAVEPGFEAAGERAARQLLKAGWPAGFAQSLLKRKAANLKMLLRPKHLPGEIGVSDLVVTRKLRDKLRIDLPIAAFEGQRGTDLVRGSCNRLFCLCRLGQADEGHAGL